MSGKFTVDTSELGNVAALLRSSAEDYDRIGKQLLQEATGMGSAYDSDDNRAFVSQIQGCCDDLQAMVKKLQSIAAVLDKQKQVYVTVTEHNTEQVRKLAN